MLKYIKEHWGGAYISAGKQISEGGCLIGCNECDDSARRLRRSEAKYH